MSDKQCMDILLTTEYTCAHLYITKHCVHMSTLVQYKTLCTHVHTCTLQNIVYTCAHLYITKHCVHMCTLVHYKTHLHVYIYIYIYMYMRVCNVLARWLVLPETTNLPPTELLSVCYDMQCKRLLPAAGQHKQTVVFTGQHFECQLTLLHAS